MIHAPPISCCRTSFVTRPHTVPITGYRDQFGNWISRIVAPARWIRFSTRAIVNDAGDPGPNLAERAIQRTDAKDLPRRDAAVPARQPILRRTDPAPV